MDALDEQLGWRQERARLFGRTIPLPRLTAWYGDVGYRYSGVDHPPAAWPPVLDELRCLVGTVVPMPNSVLANLYRDGRDSVSWHADDEPELGSHPVIASVSLGATRRFLLRHRAGRGQPGQPSAGAPEKVAVDLTHGSLLVMAGDCQRCWHHAVPKSSRPVGPRINLTFRR
ncbi:MAG: alpha-ketoglutarate-dependent dioxygenase AlkB family protein, partial [Acidimicrobiales bacterium]